jgi:hypothetical protein
LIAAGSHKETGHAIKQDGPDILSLHRAWFNGQLDLEPERLVFTDETWAVTNMTRSQGRAAEDGRPHGKF